MHNKIFITIVDGKIQSIDNTSDLANVEIITVDFDADEKEKVSIILSSNKAAVQKFKPTEIGDGDIIFWKEVEKLA